MLCNHAAPTPSADSSVGLVPDAAFDAGAFEDAVRALLKACGLPLDSIHTERTPQRVRELWQHRLLDGYTREPIEELGEGFADSRTDMVIIKDIAIHGICPHHLLPFHGLAHVAYVPGGRLHGFGRIARMVDAISHRMTYQEWMTRDIATLLMQAGHTQGAACLVETQQLCLMLGENRRGNERVITHAFVGCFASQTAQQEHFFATLRQRV